MKYNCKILKIDEEEVTILIKNVQVTGFVNNGLTASVGEELFVDISLFDDLEISESNNLVAIDRKGQSFAYSLYGTLNVESAVLESVIDFELETDDLFEYGYLHEKQVKIDVKRVDFCFEC